MCLAWEEMVVAGEGVVPTRVVVPRGMYDVWNAVVPVGAPLSCGHGGAKGGGLEQVKVKVMEVACGK